MAAAILHIGESLDLENGLREAVDDALYGAISASTVADGPLDFVTSGLTRDFRFRFVETVRQSVSSLGRGPTR